VACLNLETQETIGELQETVGEPQSAAGDEPCSRRKFPHHCSGGRSITGVSLDTFGQVIGWLLMKM